MALIFPFVSVADTGQLVLSKVKSGLTRDPGDLYNLLIRNLDSCLRVPGWFSSAGGFPHRITASSEIRLILSAGYKVSGSLFVDRNKLPFQFYKGQSQSKTVQRHLNEYYERNRVLSGSPEGRRMKITLKQRCRRHC